MKTRLRSSASTSVWAAGVCLLLFTGSRAYASDGLPEQLQQRLQDSAHTIAITGTVAEVKDHVIGLGALQKISGTWRYKHSERLSGQINRSSWQVIDGFSSQEILEGIVADIEADESGELVFRCDGRACGPGSQWANRVFGERILYGREDMQRYRVFLLKHDLVEYWIVLYASVRTADRQYLRFDTLTVELTPEQEPDGAPG
jgi:hypothetical protein